MRDGMCVCYFLRRRVKSKGREGAVNEGEALLYRSKKLLETNELHYVIVTDT